MLIIYKYEPAPCPKQPESHAGYPLHNDAVPSLNTVAAIDISGVFEMYDAYLHTSRTFPPPSAIV